MVKKVIPAMFVLMFLLCSSALAITDYTGWWWEGENKSGTGISIEDQGDTIYLAWYGYDESGKPVWYSALMYEDGSAFAGDLYEYSGWPLENDNPAQGYSAVKVGPISIEFNNTETAVLIYSVDVMSYMKTLSRFWSGNNDPRSLHGWWYDPNYSGMGVFLEARGGQLFASWYHYRADQSPRWWITIGNFPEQSASYSGNWGEYSSGQTLTGVHTSPVVSGDKGNVSLQFQDESHATMQWLGHTYNLQRFGFGSEDNPEVYVRGTWDVSGDWDCNGIDVINATWTLYSDNSFTTNDEFSGTWSQSGTTITLNYTSGTTYTGTLEGRTMSGTMESFSGATGCWSAEEDLSDVYVHSTWVLNYDWKCDGEDIGETLWTLYSNHSFDTGSGYAGTWSQSGNTMTFNYFSGTTYTGTLEDYVLSGTMISHSGSTGCWEASQIYF